MAPKPFLTLPIRSCRDLVNARYLARQVAQLLRFSADDVMGIAAGAFVVANQARCVFREGLLCFAVVDRQLRVFAKPSSQAESRQGSELCKSLPSSEQQMDIADIPWLIRQVQLLAPMSLQQELARQNLEVLELLSALRAKQVTPESAANPTAA